MIPCGYHEVGDFFEGFAKVKVNVRDKTDVFSESMIFGGLLTNQARSFHSPMKR